jgi:hypothetical protein
MPRKIILAWAFALLLTSVAFAQMPMPGLTLGKDKPPPTAEERAKQKALDDAYSAATKKIPEKKATDDPWGNVRPNPSASAKDKQ